METPVPCAPISSGAYSEQQSEVIEREGPDFCESCHNTVKCYTPYEMHPDTGCQTCHLAHEWRITHHPARSGYNPGMYMPSVSRSAGSQ